MTPIDLDKLREFGIVPSVPTEDIQNQPAPERSETPDEDRDAYPLHESFRQLR